MMVMNTISGENKNKQVIEEANEDCNINEMLMLENFIV